MARTHIGGINNIFRNLVTSGVMPVANMLSQTGTYLQKSFNAANPHMSNVADGIGDALWSFGDMVKDSTSIITHTAKLVENFTHGTVNTLQNTASDINNGDFLNAGFDLVGGTGNMIIKTVQELPNIGTATFNTIGDFTDIVANLFFIPIDSGLVAYSAVTHQSPVQYYTEELIKIAGASGEIADEWISISFAKA